jgi:hypothetical protein
LWDFRLAVDPNDIEHDVSILDHAKAAQAKSERLNKRPVVAVGRGTNRQETYPHRDLWLLRARRERPRRRAAEHAEKFPPSHASNLTHRNGETIALRKGLVGGRYPAFRAGRRPYRTSPAQINL